MIVLEQKREVDRQKKKRVHKVIKLSSIYKATESKRNQCKKARVHFLPSFLIVHTWVGSSLFLKP